MVNWIREPQASREVTELRYSFLEKDSLSGYSFEVDDHHQILLHTDAQRQNYQQCRERAARGEMTEVGLEEYVLGHDRDYGAIRCKCGAKVELTGHWEGDACPRCGAEYNWCGQRLRDGWRKDCLDELVPE